MPEERVVLRAPAVRWGGVLVAAAFTLAAVASGGAARIAFLATAAVYLLSLRLKVVATREGLEVTNWSLRRRWFRWEEIDDVLVLPYYNSECLTILVAGRRRPVRCWAAGTVTGIGEAWLEAAAADVRARWEAVTGRESIETRLAKSDGVCLYTAQPDVFWTALDAVASRVGAHRDDDPDGTRLAWAGTEVSVRQEAVTRDARPPKQVRALGTDAAEIWMTWRRGSPLAVAFAADVLERVPGLASRGAAAELVAPAALAETLRGSRVS